MKDGANLPLIIGSTLGVSPWILTFHQKHGVRHPRKGGGGGGRDRYASKHTPRQRDKRGRQRDGVTDRGTET